jgi:hypothetical protein
VDVEEDNKGWLVRACGQLVVGQETIGIDVEEENKGWLIRVAVS